MKGSDCSRIWIVFPFFFMEFYEIEIKRKMALFSKPFQTCSVLKGSVGTRASSQGSLWSGWDLDFRPKRIS